MAIEDPGFPAVRAVLAATGAKIIAVPVYEEARLSSNTQTIYVTRRTNFQWETPYRYGAECRFTFSNDFVHCLERHMDTGSQAMACHEAPWN